MHTSSLMFNAERHDAPGTLYHPGQGYRGYDPRLMRFITPDSWSPFGQEGINGYVWCAGEPVSRPDPSGHMSWQAGGGLFLSIVGLAPAGISAGMSLLASESLMVALAATPVSAQLTTLLAATADVAGIVSVLTREKHPDLSAMSAWISFSTGLAAAVTTPVSGCLQLPMKLRKEMTRQQARMNAIAARAMGGRASKSVTRQVAPQRPGLRLPELSAGQETYLYRGIRAGHPEEENALRGIVVPANEEARAEIRAHNAGEVSNSPYTSWTREPALARRYAGQNGIVLRVRTTPPGPGESWNWEMSPDAFWESEVLMKERRTTGVDVFLP